MCCHLFVNKFGRVDLDSVREPSDATSFGNMISFLIHYFPLQSTIKAGHLSVLELKPLNTPDELFIMNWKMNKVVFFLIFGSHDLKNVKKSGGPCACFKFYGPPLKCPYILKPNSSAKQKIFLIVYGSSFPIYE